MRGARTRPVAMDALEWFVQESQAPDILSILTICYVPFIELVNAAASVRLLAMPVRHRVRYVLAT